MSLCIEHQQPRTFVGIERRGRIPVCVRYARHDRNDDSQPTASARDSHDNKILMAGIRRSLSTDEYVASIQSGAIDNLQVYLNDRLLCVYVRTERKWIAHEDAIFDLAWSPDNRTILSAAGDYSIRSWDVEHAALISEFRGHSGSIKAVVFRNYDPRMWRTLSDLMQRPLMVRCSALDVFASAGRDGSINLWDTRSRVHLDADGARLQAPLITMPLAHEIQKTLDQCSAQASTPLRSGTTRSSPRPPRSPPLTPGAGGGGAGGTSRISRLNAVTCALFLKDDNLLVSGGANDGYALEYTKHTRVLWLLMAPRSMANP